jgi:hypothetical protein
VDTPGPANDRSLTADEARAWELIETDLRLRARRRHRIAGFVAGRVRRPAVIAGLNVLVLGLAVTGTALLSRRAAFVAGLAVVGAGLMVVLVGSMFRPRRTRSMARGRRLWRRARRGSGRSGRHDPRGATRSPWRPRRQRRRTASGDAGAPVRPPEAPGNDGGCQSA